MMYPNGTIKIIDRSKNIFKLSQGEYIAPEKIEQMFMVSPYIAQSMVYGDSLKSCAVAVIVPQPDKVAEHAQKTGKEAKDVLTDPDFKKLIMDDITRIAETQKLSGLEKPDRKSVV